MSENGSRRYIGVDLGAWYNNKTRIAVLEEDKRDKSKLVLVFLDAEPLKTKEPEERNKRLIERIEQEANGNALIAIDAPFAIPSPFSKNKEDYYSVECTPAMKNQYLFDNSARFVYKKTKQQAQVLAPTATLVGALTSRMVHMVDNYFDILGICKMPNLDKIKRERKVSTIEVFPRATLVKIIKKKYSEIEKIPQYKNRKKKGEYFKNKEGKDNMLDLIEPYITNLNENDWKDKIETDDDYDAIICALTAYWVDQKNGYEKPEDKDIDKFTNSFIYIPRIK